MSCLDPFGPATRAWFSAAFPAATPVQERGWPPIARGEHTLLLAPTGSGKTLAAFLWCLDRLVRLPGDAAPGVRVVYVSPLKALAYDVERNLRAPLVGIRRAAERLGLSVRVPQVDLRTGDTSTAERRRQAREPGDVLVTTPESLYLILGSAARENLRTVETVIVDEIHALADRKRGVHLALTLERLAELAAPRDPQRIGLSATQRPLEEIGRFLGGDRPVTIVDAAAPPALELEVVVPLADMTRPGAALPHRPLHGGPLLARRHLAPDDPEARTSIWPAIHPAILERIQAHRSTIVFTNSRILSERLCHRLNELAAEQEAEADERGEAGGDDGGGWPAAMDEGDAVPDGVAPAAGLASGPGLVRAHHGSIARPARVAIEEALKRGELKGIVATSSLELGIDMGAVDLVVQVESPGSVARGLQRIGRAGHGVGEVSRGVIFPKHRGDLLEAAVVAREMLAGRIEPTRVPTACLDVLAQQLVAICSTAPRRVDELERLVRRAYPYRDLSRPLLLAVLDMLSGRYPSDELAELRPRLVWNRETDELAARRDAKSVALVNAGTIPDRGLYGVHLGAAGPRIGELDEEMVHESRAGQVFVLGASSWRIQEITRDRVVVEPAAGEPGKLPFWKGAGPGRPVELGRALGAFVRELAALPAAEAESLLARECRLDERARRNLLDYLAEQHAHTGTLPTDRAITVERFRDELGDWRVCILSPFGARVHAPWALAIEATLGREAGFSVQTVHSDDGIVLRLADGGEDGLPAVLERLVPDPEEVEELVVEALGASALFGTHFRENAARALLLPRRRPGRRTPLWAQRIRAQNLLGVVRRYPDFPIVLETYRELLCDVFDLPALVELLRAVRARELRVEHVETPSASPFSRSLVFGFVAAYLYEGDLPLAERRAMTLSLDRKLLTELLGQEALRELLDPRALTQVEDELQGLAEGWQARSADGLHDLLRRIGELRPDELAPRCEVDPAPWLAELQAAGRVFPLRIAGELRLAAVEDVARLRDALGAVPPPGVAGVWLEPADEPLEGLLRRYARTHGPFRTAEPAARFGLAPAAVQAALARLEGLGQLVRGELRPDGTEREWCDPEVLRRLRRRSLALLREEAAPVDGPALARFLPRWQGVVGSEGDLAAGAARLLEVVEGLEGLYLPWSELVGRILPRRVPAFTPALLDELGASGELVWVGRGGGTGADGRVALFRRERAALLLDPPLPLEVEGAGAGGDPLARQVLELLEARGACFTAELQALLPRVRLEDLLHAIWDLVWTGRASNDTFLPLHALGSGRGGVRRGDAAAAAPVGLGSSRGSRRPGVLPGRPGRGGALGGRWYPVSRLVGPAEPTRRAHALAIGLLERYGVLARGVAAAEEVAGGFAALEPVLQAMEDAGRVRRGWFVDGLPGAQYALPGAVELLRRAREGEGEDDAGLALAAVDPANPYGMLLPWPPLADAARTPRRVAGATLVLVAGRPVFHVERGWRGLDFFAEVEDGAAEHALAALAAEARRTRRRSIQLDRVDGGPAQSSPRAGLLVRFGFRPVYRSLVWEL